MCFACSQSNILDQERLNGFVAPTALLGVMADSPVTYGGKAAGLARLSRVGMPIPPTWVIPCEYSLSRPEVTFREFLINNFNQNHYSETIKTLFAVRSGAPTSMPGMMETRLNVPYEGLVEAVNAVWDSYNSDHCKLYRETKGIPDQGTAVLIQEMVTPEQRGISVGGGKGSFDSQYSGVAFTANPNKPLFVGGYDPVIEYVDGLGDKLVGGTSTPVKFEYNVDEPWHVCLSEWLVQIHDTYGPSDVEWTVVFNKQLPYNYSVVMLQHRPLKFAPVSKEELVAARGQVIATGRSIGAPVRVTGMLTTNAAEAAGKLLYADEFTPELYKAMMQASGIVCKVGGETCHAAIVARELNKPAISGVSKFSILVPVTLDGTDGTLRLAVDDDIDAAVSTRDYVIDPTRCPDFSFVTSGNSWSANQLLPRVYVNLDNLKKGLITEERFNFIVGEVASLFATYFYIAVACEARHADGEMYPHSGGTSLQKQAQYERIKASLTDRGVRIINKLSNRQKFFDGEIDEPEDIHVAIANMAACRTLYNEFSWSRAFGGPKWGGIAEMVLSYFTGEFTPLMFVDACFNLVHNNGCAFNKFDWLRADADRLNSQLDAKRHGDISSLVSRYIPDALLDCDSILPQKEAAAA
jgi:phosphohistidine swiveling domain-containing protein